MNESEIERDCKGLAMALGWVVYKGHGREGAPDKIFLKSGRGFTVEFKQPGCKQSDAQIREENYVINRGVSYYLVDNLEQFKTVLLIEEHKT